jgi:predicted phosphate transport protein (TIGR00153 family)
MARLSLVPQKREFFDLYNRAAENTVAIAKLLVRLLESFPQDADAIMRDVKDLEHEGDRLTHEVVDLLNRTFVTPFDRDDMYRLAGALDDVCDYVDEAAGKVVGFGVTEIREQARGQARVIERAAAKLCEAVALLEGFRDSRLHLIELRELEDEGDLLAHAGVSDLFANEPDPLSVIRWKDIHESLEEAVDACENAADVLEAILVKNR